MHGIVKSERHRDVTSGLSSRQTLPQFYPIGPTPSEMYTNKTLLNNWMEDRQALSDPAPAPPTEYVSTYSSLHTGAPPTSSARLEGLKNKKAASVNYRVLEAPEQLTTLTTTTKAKPVSTAEPSQTEVDCKLSMAAEAMQAAGGQIRHAAVSERYIIATKENAQLSLAMPSEIAERKLSGTSAPHTVNLAEDPKKCAHGKLAAFVAAPRIVSITATQSDIARRPGTRIWADE